MNRREKIEKMLTAEPDDVFLNFGLAMELVKAQRFDEAVAHFQRVRELDPDYTAAYYHAGRTLITLGQAETARAILGAGLDAARRIGNKHAESEMRELIDSI